MSDSRPGTLPPAVEFDPERAPLDPLAAAAASPAGTVVLLVASAARDWSAAAAVELGAAWARGGRRLVLADLHLENPRLHELAGVPNLEGVVDVFLYGASIARSARPVRGRGFYLIPAGTYEADDDAVFHNPRWGKLVAGFREAGATLALFVPADAAAVGALSRWASEVVLLGRPVDERGLADALGADLPVRALLVPPGQGDALPEPAPLPTWDDDAALPPPPDDPDGWDSPVALADPLEEPAEWLPDRGAADWEGPPAAAPAGPEPAPLPPPAPLPRPEPPPVAEARAPAEAPPPSEAQARPVPKVLFIPESAPDDPDDLQLPPPPHREQRRRSRVPLLVLLAVLVVLILGAVGFLLAGGRLPWMARTAPAVAPVASRPGAPPPAPVRQGVPLPYSVHVKAFASLPEAQRQLEEDQRRFSEAPLYVFPEVIQGVLYYRILAGAAADSATAGRWLERLVAAGAVEKEDAAATTSLVQEASLAYDLGEFPSAERAAASADSLRARRVYAYAVPVPYSDGSRRWQLYGGAFRESSRAEAMGRELRQAGLTPRLVLRQGARPDSVAAP